MNSKFRVSLFSDCPTKQTLELDDAVEPVCSPLLRKIEGVCGRLVGEITTRRENLGENR